MVPRLPYQRFPAAVLEKHARKKKAGANHENFDKKKDGRRRGDFSCGQREKDEWLPLLLFFYDMCCSLLLLSLFTNLMRQNTLQDMGDI